MIKYEQFRNNLQNCIQQSGLDAGSAYYIFKDVLRELEAFYYSELKKEQEALKEKASE